MKESSCYTSFEITGNFKFKELAEVLGIEPFGGWDGEELRPDGKPFGFSRLSLCLCDEYDVYISNMMEKTIEPLWEKMELLKELKERLGLDMELLAVPTIAYETYGDEGEFSSVTPCLSPSLKVMRFCCELGAELDIDYFIDD